MAVQTTAKASIQKSALVRKRRRATGASSCRPKKARRNARFSVECLNSAQPVHSLEHERKAMMYKQADLRAFCYLLDPKYIMIFNQLDHSCPCEGDTYYPTNTFCDQSITEIIKRQKRIARFVDMILEEQLDQWYTFENDPERLAKISIVGSTQSRLDAMTRGLSDALSY